MKKLNLLVMAAVFVALLVPTAWGQTGTVKGTVKGPDGKPVAGAVVQMVDKASGRKYELKSDKNGNIFSLGIAGGSYDVTVLQNGQPIFQAAGYPVKMGEENTLDVDLQKEAQRQQAQMTPEQKKAIEQQQNERNKIKNLNEMLAQARAASEAGNFDQAKQLMTQATQVDPNREILWFQLGEAQRNAALKATDANEKKTGLEAAVESYNKALKLVPNTKPDVMGAIYNQMGEAYARMGNTDQAAKAYDAAAAADLPNAAKYYFNEGAVLTNASHYKEANEAFGKAIQADPTKADAYYWKGSNGVNMATMDKDNKMVVPPGTEEAFNKYLELDPNGKHVEEAKAMLQALGAKVETTFGKSKAAAKKK
ncbi:MAG: carboxypeptidase regulatory-like domain-containing protein [Terriglobales bacterium]